MTGMHMGVFVIIKMKELESFRRKEEESWRCERCKHPHETPRNRSACDEICNHENDGKQRMLTVHHLDMNKSNNRYWNLAVLCQKCHLEIQAKVDFDQDYMFDHSKWMEWHVVQKNMEERDGKAFLSG